MRQSTTHYWCNHRNVEQRFTRNDTCFALPVLSHQRARAFESNLSFVSTYQQLNLKSSTSASGAMFCFAGSFFMLEVKQRRTSCFYSDVRGLWHAHSANAFTTVSYDLLWGFFWSQTQLTYFLMLFEFWKLNKPWDVFHFNFNAIQCLQSLFEPYSYILKISLLKNTSFWLWLTEWEHGMKDSVLGNRNSLLCSEAFVLCDVNMWFRG